MFYVVYIVYFHFKVLESFSNALQLLCPGTEKNMKISKRFWDLVNSDGFQW